VRDAWLLLLRADPPSLTEITGRRGHLARLVHPLLEGDSTDYEPLLEAAGPNPYGTGANMLMLALTAAAEHRLFG
jgi:hypothetical protein